MKKMAILTLLALIPISAIAEDRDAKIRALMEAQGLLGMFEEQLEMGKVQGEQVGQQMMSQLMSQLNPNEEFQEQFQQAFTSFMKKLQTPWAAEEIVDVWANYYGKHFSDSELDQLLKFYTSEIGKKEVAASKSALPEFTMHFQKLSEPLFQKATEEYISDLKQVAKSCNCAKK